MMRPRRLLLLAVLLALALPAAASAAPLADDAGAEWQVEQPPPPPPEEAGIEPSGVPVALGRIGDIEFYAPNKGALITSGNGSTVKPGVWFYDGTGWRELSNQCGATDGRIAWAGPDEFWTVSDGRPGQAVFSRNEEPPLEDNTLCHFAPGAAGRLEIVASYASPPFEASSYLPMHAAACISSSDCWFGGDPLAEPQIGTFQLHWNGNTIEAEPYLPEGHAAWSLTPFEGRLYEGLRLLPSDRVTKAVPRPPALHRINPIGASKQFETVTGLPLYEEGEFSSALDYLHLSAADEKLWAAAGPQLQQPAGSIEPGVSVMRKANGGAWTKVLGPQEGLADFNEEAEGEKGPETISQRLVAAGAEPGTESIWLGLDSRADVASPSPLARARIVRLKADGSLSDEEALPGAGDPHGPLGAARQIVCPATHDCWASTTRGWLLHLATPEERAHPEPEGDPVFAAIEAGEPITFRPHDEGVPQEPSDELPVDNSGEEKERRSEEVIKAPTREPVKLPVPLLTHVHSRVIHGTTLVLSFHLAVKARVRLLAERKRKVVARTPMRTLAGGNRSLELKLERRRWPTKLNLQTHALAPLPTTTTNSPNVNNVSTSFLAPLSKLLTGLSL